jgi:hypothetical protein
MLYTPMKKLNNLNDLKSERLRLRLQLVAVEEELKSDLEWIKEELNPVKAAGRFLGNAFINKNNGIINDGVKITIDTLLKNIILSRSGWLVKLIVPFIIKNISSNYILENKSEIFSVLKNLIHKIRKSNTHSDNHFDKSTVDEMNF